MFFVLFYCPHTQKTIESNNNKVNQQIPFQSENILILINTADLLSMCRWSKRTNILRERGVGKREEVMDDTTAQVKSTIHWFSNEKKKPGRINILLEIPKVIFIKQLRGDFPRIQLRNSMEKWIKITSISNRRISYIYKYCSHCAVISIT